MLCSVRLHACMKTAFAETTVDARQLFRLLVKFLFCIFSSSYWSRLIFLYRGFWKTCEFLLPFISRRLDRGTNHKGLTKIIISGNTKPFFEYHNASYEPKACISMVRRYKHGETEVKLQKFLLMSDCRIMLAYWFVPVEYISCIYLQWKIRWMASVVLPTKIDWS